MTLDTVFLRDDTKFKPVSRTGLNIYEHLPAGVYTVCRTLTGFHLESSADFDMPPKLYGSTTSYADRLAATFHARNQSTGALLVGEKGSGKTLLAKSLAMQLHAKGIPTLLVNQPLCGPEFNQFLQSITQPVMVLFDEFEKVYDRDTQSQLLSLLDGVYPTKKMFVLTANDKWAIDEHMRNRPGRLRYLLTFDGLDPNFVVEYLRDRLNDKTQVDDTLVLLSRFTKINFDMLQALVEEMNMYNESAQSAARLLNIRMDSDTQRFTMECIFDGHRLKAPGEVQVDPLSFEHMLYLQIPAALDFPKELRADYCEEDYDEENEDHQESSQDPQSKRPYGVRVLLADRHLTELNGQTGEYVYDCGHGLRFKLTRVRTASRAFDY